MTATATAFLSAARTRTAVSSRLRLSRQQIAGILLLLPAVGFLLAFFVIPALLLFAYSILTQHLDGTVALPFTLSHLGHFFTTGLYTRVLIATLRMAAITALLAALLGYPVALVMVHSRAAITHVLTIVVIAPLIVSVVVRTYGWQLILGNSRTGVLNWALMSLGLMHQPVRILYTETAVIIASLHVFHRVTLPLSLPGLAVGFTLVFSLTASSYVTPAILGGTGAQMLGNLIDQQITAVYDWPFGAAVAVVLVGTVMAINLTSTWFLERRDRA